MTIFNYVRLVWARPLGVRYEFRIPNKLYFMDFK